MYIPNLNKLRLTPWIW